MCWNNQYLQWYNENGNKICWTILIGSCGAAHWISTENYPVSWHCNSWIKQDIDINWRDGDYNWICKWDLWWDTNCSASSKVNGGWSNWSSWWTCNVECWWWTQIRTRSCTNPSPQNGGNNCVWSTTTSQSCNLQACYTYSWVIWDWWVCTSQVQTRKNSCKRSDGTIVSDSYCGNNQPSTTQNCATTGAYTYGTWSSCSLNCWWGVQTRQEYCNYDNCTWKQETNRSCNTQACAVAVNGVCGWNNGATLSSKPTTNLCNTWTAGEVTWAGPWNWVCLGTGWWTTIACNSDKTLVVEWGDIVWWVVVMNTDIWYWYYKDAQFWKYSVPNQLTCPQWWRFPTVSELQSLYSNKNTIWNFKNWVYWTDHMWTFQCEGWASDDCYIPWKMINFSNGSMINGNARCDYWDSGWFCSDQANLRCVKDIPSPTPVNWACWLVTWYLLYWFPQSGHCSAGKTYITDSIGSDGTYNRSCRWISWWSDVSCQAASRL